MIRFLELKDIKTVYKIYEYYIVSTSITFEITVPSLEEFTERVLNISKNYPYVVYEQDGKVVGYAYATRYGVREAFQWVVESTVYVDQNYKNKGIGKILYTKLLELLKSQGFHTAYALVTSANVNSLSFHEKLGFKYMAKFDNLGYKQGEWHGIIYYSYELNPYTNPPRQLLDINQLKQSCSYGL